MQISFTESPNRGMEEVGGGGVKFVPHGAGAGQVAPVYM